MNEIDFSGKTVLVIGGSSGIGNGIARVFRDHGATVFVSGTRTSAEEYSGKKALICPESRISNSMSQMTQTWNNWFLHLKSWMCSCSRKDS